MGQKVSPHGLRVGVIQDWDSKWYANKKNFADYLVEDNKVREFVKKELYAAGVSKVVVERAAEGEMRVTILVARPGMVMGNGGEQINNLKAKLDRLTKKQVTVSVIEVKKPDSDAQLAAESIADALEKRVAFRRAMKQAIQKAMKAGAKGIKVVISGRVGGAEIARSEKYAEGNVPLHTLRANIDYGFAEADTQYGRIGVKVWVNDGEVLDGNLLPAIPEEKDEAPRREGRGKRGEGRGDRRDRGERGDRRERGDRGDRRERGERKGKFNKEDRPAKPVNPRKRPAKPVETKVEEPVAEAPEAVQEVTENVDA